MNLIQLAMMKAFFLFLYLLCLISQIVIVLTLSCVSAAHSSRGDDVDEDVAHDHWSHHDAQSAANCQAAVAVELSAKSWSNQLRKHFKWVQ